MPSAFERFDTMLRGIPAPCPAESAFEHLAHHARHKDIGPLAGERLTVTVDGRPAADLVPHTGRRRFATRDELIRFFASRTPTPSLRDDVRKLVPDTTDDV
jgi:antitoxin (DNA-binding transcriptional repressor) of toxin-antitoxin stability system